MVTLPEFVALLFRIEVIADRQLGVALRQTFYSGDDPALCYELRDVTLGPADAAAFRVEIPPGARITGTGLLDHVGASPAAAAKATAGLGLAGAAALAGWLQKRPADRPATDSYLSDNSV